MAQDFKKSTVYQIYPKSFCEAPFIRFIRNHSATAMVTASATSGASSESWITFRSWAWITSG